MSFPARTLNRALEHEPWARERLAVHAGRRFTLEIGPSTWAFTIGADGSLTDDSSATGSPDLRLALPLSALPALLAEPQRWRELVSADGDAALAASLAELATTLPWFVERAFARALGPVAGQRAADLGRSALAAPEAVASRVVAGFARYARDEGNLLVHPAELERATRETGELAARADTLEGRIRRLEDTRDAGG